MSSTKKTLLIFIFSTLIVSSGYGFLLHFISKQKVSAESFREELAYEVDQQERLRLLERLLQDVTEGREVIDSQFLSGEGDIVAEYIANIESLAQYTQATLIVNSVSTVGAESGNSGSLQIRISASGSQESIRRLIQMVESLPVFTSIESTSLSIVNNEIGSPEWHANFTLRALISST